MVDRDDIIRMAREAGCKPFRSPEHWDDVQVFATPNVLERFAALVAEHERKACIEIIETYRIPVGNSRSGELACEWTYRALHEIRDDIRARGEAEYKRGEQ
jgi:hypothetical protein